jgi:CheY-like chemotaxis protein
LGLGLAIVKQLVDLHGGSVGVSSDGENQGTTFSIHLPLAVVPTAFEDYTRSLPDAFGTEQETGAGIINLRGVKVLVVDDEPDALALIRRVLEQSNASVIEAASADAGSELLRSEKPDVLISDIGMPVKDGFEFIREVRALPAEDGGRTPAVALTAFARSEDRTRALMAGYQLHLSKPIEHHELVVTVMSLATRGIGEHP